MGIETAYHILSAHLWTNTVVGHEVWRNRQRWHGTSAGQRVCASKRPGGRDSTSHRKAAALWFFRQVPEI